MLANRFTGRARTIIVAVGVLQIYFACIAANVMDPALHDLQQLFPGISHEQIASLITIPNLAAIPASILSGALTGRRLRYRTVLTMSFLLIVVGGSAPLFLMSFQTVVCARMVLGFGLGLLWPLGNALIIDLFPGERRAYMFGVGEVVKNVSLIILQMIVGLLVGVSAKISWSAYLVLLLSLAALLLCLPEPEIRPVAAQTPLAAAIRQLPRRLYVFILFYCVCMIVQTIYQLNMSSIIVTEGLGDATTAATVLSTATLTAMFAALSFGLIQKVLGDYTITFCAGALGLGTFCISQAATLPPMYASAVIVGIGLGTMSSSFYVKIAECANNENAALVSGFQVVLGGLGGYLPSYFLVLVAAVFNSQSLRLPIALGTLLLGSVAVGFALFYAVAHRRAAAAGGV
ncbi:major facilitator superfamily MFS_1 [Coriobacterium glomerans PW2]|uniref:Major facilitator superfamily MFS_1 n=1 Tax=Coriobacterium glomerans (strain ATCC 49209 / DSM 20642 / JCM 10262 / PW2) TaxID=700015 RepID=F2N8A8_CORGP|nr:MFS transporter [Coriobacterium glomerans]AEB07291.1 major facilitator superfamily MFS_1 [Coriobacterium glomerans PW2]